MEGYDRAAIAEAVAVLGASRCVLTSDAGQRHNPYPGEALRVFGQQLHELGIPLDHIYKMIRSNPAIARLWKNPRHERIDNRQFSWRHLAAIAVTM